MLSTVIALQEFLGVMKYYHWFLAAIAATLGSLYASLTGKPKDPKGCLLPGDAFCDTKIALPTAGAPTFLAPHVPLLLSTDDSTIAIGTILDQGINGLATSLAFFN
ncbi:uncharacterized protein [Palaemon carinicauda]|uniref:uncharacterized protein n=1 Tax=Palaemon carinicauda TaxID=392227 RepID=UPI0035B65E02